MTKRNDVWWCSANLFCKLFLVSLLLQYSLGFNIIEDEDPPTFYQYFEDFAWNIPQKVPRGYMVPVPRVGRRRIHEEKRQNMIPQPRIGRELEPGQELAEILYGVLNFLHDTKFQLPVESLTPGNAFHGKDLTPVSRDTIAKYVKYLPENSILANKDTTLSRKEISDISHLSDEDSVNSIPEHKIDVSFNTKDGSNLSKETKNSGFDIFDGDKHEGLLPLSRLERAKLLTALEDKKQIGGLIASPRLGRQTWELHPTLIPYIRAGRIVLEPESSDYDALLSSDFGTFGLDDSLTDAFLTNQPVVKKSRAMQFIPRIGRKKRSVLDEQTEHEESPAGEIDQDEANSENKRRIWNRLQELDNNYFYRTEKNLRSKNAFIPRIGKKRSDNFEDFEEKRAVAFTPRIGRAALIPRIGRSDPRFRLKSRGAFIPRVGRRAALIPRIGRSASQEYENEETN